MMQSILFVPCLLASAILAPLAPGAPQRSVPPQQSAGAVVLARLVDENLEPIADVDVDWSFALKDGNRSSSSSISVRTDPEGRLRVPLAEPRSTTGRRSVYVSRNDRTRPAGKHAFAEVELPADFTTGTLDLGELIVVPYGAPARFVRLDDEALGTAFALECMSSSWGLGDDQAEEILCEVLRRRGPRWEARVAGWIAELRDDQESREWRSPGQLEMLTALRRLQGKPDPLEVRVPQDHVLEATFPASPRVEFELVNRDVHRESILVRQGGHYRSGRFERCNVLAVAEDGKTVPPREWSAFLGGGLSTLAELEPGDSIRSSVSLGDYVALQVPGTYRVRLRYHNADGIATAHSMAGRIVSTSEEFRVRIHPLRIEIRAGKLAETRAWIRAIELGRPIPLVSGHWHPELEFRGAASLPEDQLFRAGWQSLPALFAAMQDPTIEPERRAWVFGMLWNILGLENPNTHTRLAAVGSVQWIETWPTSTDAAQANWNEYGTFSPTSLDPEVQAALAEAWRSWQGAIQVTILP